MSPEAPRHATETADNSSILIDRHRALVHRIAWQVHRRMSTAIDVEDLIQIGLIALIEAARNFEQRGIAFTPYATTRIRGAMIDSLRRDAQMPRSGMANRRYLVCIRARPQNAYMRAPSDAEMVLATGLEPPIYLNLAASAKAIQHESIENSDSDHGMWFADLADAADTALEKRQLGEATADNFGKLSECEALVLNLYFVEERNLDEIGDSLGIGAARVYQIKKATLDKMRAMMAA